MIAIGFLSRSPGTMSENLMPGQPDETLFQKLRGPARVWVGLDGGLAGYIIIVYVICMMACLVRHSIVWRMVVKLRKAGTYCIHGCGLEGWLCIVCLVAWPAPCVENSGRSALLLLEHSAIPWHYICTHRIRLLLAQAASLPSDSRGWGNRRTAVTLRSNFYFFLFLQFLAKCRFFMSLSQVIFCRSLTFSSNEKTSQQIILSRICACSYNMLEHMMRLL